MANNHFSLQQAYQLIRLLKLGEASSLTQLRGELGRTQEDLALDIGIASRTLEMWETGKQQPSRIQYANWKIKLSTCIDDKLSGLLGTEDTQINTKFWAIIWELVG